MRTYIPSLTIINATSKKLWRFVNILYLIYQEFGPVLF